MKIKSQKGSITIFVLIALLFYTAFLLLMYAANTNKLVAIKEKSDILKGIYEKNTSEESINNIYNKKNTEQLIAGIEKISLPAEYQQVAYLESTGTQYIDTGIKNDMNFGYIQSKFQITSTNESRYYIFGCYSNNANNLNRLQFSFSNPYFIGIGNNNSYTNSLANEKISTNPITVKLTTTQCIIDDEVIYTGTGYTTIPNSVNIYIFACNAGGSVSNIAKDTRIYNFNIYNNENELVRNFIPCYRKSDNKPGLFDLVENKFYTNQGDGEEDFTVGPDID